MTLDPTQTLTQIREYTGELREAPDADTQNLVEHVEALDQWLSKGGFLPSQWNNRGRPRAETEGQVLDGVEHGTSYAYAKGCRCTPCRTANREKAARWRQRQKEQQQ